MLSNKKSSIAIVLIVILARGIQQLFYLDSFFDTTFQVIATQNLLSGHGLSTAIVKAGDLSATIYQPLINWPPGYSLLLAPFYSAFGQNYLAACYVLDIIAVAALIIITRKILFLQGVGLPLINLFTLVHGFFIYYFFFSGSTDSISIIFFLGAIYLILRTLRDNKYWNSRAAVAGVFLFLSAAMKYLFFPVVFIIPAFLLLYAHQNRLLTAKRAALISFLIAGTGIAILYGYQKIISGAGTYISAGGRGFFPEHLLKAHPFFPCAFLTPNTAGLIAGDAKDTLMNFFRFVHLLLFTGMLITVVVFLLRSGLRNASPSKAFLFLTCFVIFAIILVLTALSLLVEKELIPPDRWWTYIEDARYYGLGDILVHLSVFALFSIYRNRVKGISRLIIIALPFLLLPESIRGFAFTVKRVTKLCKEEYYWKQEVAFQRFADAAIRPLQDSLKVKKVIIASSLYYVSYRSSLYRKAPVLEDLEALKALSLLQTKEPVLLLVMLSSESRGSFEELINDPRTRFAGIYNRFYFYTLYVTPG